MLNKAFEKTLKKAAQHAKQLKHKEIEVEHLLYALLDNEDAALLLTKCKLNFELLIAELNAYFLTLAVDAWDASSSEIFRKGGMPAASIQVQRVLNQAVYDVKQVSEPYITGADVLVALYLMENSYAVYLLEKQNIFRADLVQYKQQIHTEAQYETAKYELTLEDMVRLEKALESEEEASIKGHQEEDLKSPLDYVRRFCVDLNAAAEAKTIDPVIGRDTDIERLAQILARRKKSNAVLVGEPGVGKTALIEGLARFYADQERNKNTEAKIGSNKRIYSLDMAALVAGTKYRGMFEERITQLIEGIKSIPNAVLFIDEIHMLIGSGASTDAKGLDAANFLKPALTDGSLKCIGATTYQEYKNVFEKDAALARRFQKITIEEPSVAEATQILFGLRGYYESFHKTDYTDEAIRAAVELSAKYIHDRYLPDKAIDLLDEAGAHQSLQPKYARLDEIGRLEIEAVVAKIANIPRDQVSQDELIRLKNLDKQLKKVVFGQDAAIDTLVSAIRLSRSGLVEDNKTIGAFLFAGSTGVGKTELSLQLAKLLGLPLHRFDMSEYASQMSLSLFLGANPGYQQAELGGVLTNAVLKNPYSIVLLDEIEKAHPEIWNTLLQVMDNGFIKDGMGRKVDFRHVLLIFTTNSGAFDAAKPSIGFQQEARVLSLEAKEKGLKALEKTFSPEFRNRLDDIIWFNSLSKEVMLKVTEKLLNDLKFRLQKYGVELKIDSLAKLWLINNGFDSSLGARPMKRLIQDSLGKPISEAVLFGDLSAGSIINVGVTEGRGDLEIDFQRANQYVLS